mmetsp:Transcript_689/g.1238  ORF Transcript_689/g.1238 Transcript_689/m.1238 type:complete len:92 (-) Transcript_689:1350-1625(-)
MPMRAERYACLLCCSHRRASITCARSFLAAGGWRGCAFVQLYVFALTYFYQMPTSLHSRRRLSYGHHLSMSRQGNGPLFRRRLTLVNATKR